MRYILPEGVSSISLDGVSYVAEFGVVDLPQQVADAQADHLAAHGLEPEPEGTAGKGKRGK